MASNVTILVGSPQNAGRDAIINNNTYNHYANQPSPGPDPLTLLKEHVAFGALHNSAERFDPPKCHAETRTAVLDLVDRWARDRSDSAQPVFWLSGAAGAGKSAIAQTLTERWVRDGVVVLSFFFWRTSAERNHKTRLIPTLSHQLSESFSSVRATIEKAIGSGFVFKKNLEAQINELLLRPLEEAPSDRCPVVVVIDGLDECSVNLPQTPDFPGQDYKSQQREILSLVASVCQRAHSPRFLICSRPEQAIRESFATGPLQKFTYQFSLNDAPNTNEDIQLFLECEFEGIRRRHPSLPSTWPSKDQLSKLVQKSSGQFIYPSTVTKYITHHAGYPDNILQAVLDLGTGSPKGGGNHPLGNLDALYALIMKSISPECLDNARFIIGLMCVPMYRAGALYLVGKPDPPKYLDPSSLAKFLFLSVGEVYAHLTDLHSVLHVPSENQPHDTIRFIHATLSEYLTDKSRSGDLHITSDTFFQRHFRLTLRHTTRNSQLPGAFEILRESGSDGDEKGIRSFFYYPDDSCPVSKELKDAAWEFLKDEIGGRSSLWRNITFGSGLYDCAPCGKQHILDQFQKAGVMWYLKRCNIPELEPSIWRRTVIAWRLKRARKIFDDYFKDVDW